MHMWVSSRSPKVAKNVFNSAAGDAFPHRAHSSRIRCGIHTNLWPQGNQLPGHLASFCFSLLMTCLKITFIAQYELLRRVSHLSRSSFSLIFPSFCLWIRLGSTELIQSVLFLPFLHRKNNGPLHFWIRRVLHTIPLLCLFWGIFPTGRGVKSDEDDRGPVCAASGVLTPPEKEERKRTWFTWVDPILSVCHKNNRGGKNRKSSSAP